MPTKRDMIKFATCLEPDVAAVRGYSLGLRVESVGLRVYSFGLECVVGGKDVECMVWGLTKRDMIKFATCLEPDVAAVTPKFYTLMFTVEVSGLRY